MGLQLKRVLAASLLLASAAGYAQDAPQPGIAPLTLGSEPYVFDTAEQHRIKVSVLVKGLQRPFGIEFLPGGDLLISERGMGMRILRQATGQAVLGERVEGVPEPAEPFFSIGIQDIKLHPDFARNHWVYFTYNDPTPRPADTPPNQRPAKLTLMRGKLENGRLSDVETLFQGGISPALGSRLAFAHDGTLYMTAGGAFGETAQDLSTIYGKVLRLNDDGSIPHDNPYFGRDDVNQAIYSYGHRDHHGLMVTDSGAVLNAEHGMNGGDEVNLIRPGTNYGWPTYTFSRQYDGSRGSPQLVGPDIEPPLIMWSPSIAPSGLMIYHGDKFPQWKGNLFVGSGRRGEIPFTGGLERVVLGKDMGDIRRETLLTELHQRVRDFAEGPDGLIYVATDGNENAVLRIEPVP